MKSYRAKATAVSDDEGGKEECCMYSLKCKGKRFYIMTQFGFASIAKHLESSYVMINGK